MAKTVNHKLSTVVTIVSNGKCAKATSKNSDLVVIAPTSQEAESLHRIFLSPPKKK